MFVGLFLRFGQVIPAFFWPPRNRSPFITSKTEQATRDTTTAAGLTSDITRRLKAASMGSAQIPLHRASKQQQSLHDRFSLDGKLEPDHGRATLRVVMNDTKHPASPIWSEAFPPERLSNSIGVEIQYPGRDRFLILGGRLNFRTCFAPSA